MCSAFRPFVRSLHTLDSSCCCSCVSLSWGPTVGRSVRGRCRLLYLEFTARAVFPTAVFLDPLSSCAFGREGWPASDLSTQRKDVRSTRWHMRQPSERSIASGSALACLARSASNAKVAEYFFCRWDGKYRAPADRTQPQAFGAAFMSVHPFVLISVCVLACWCSGCVRVVRRESCPF